MSTSTSPLHTNAIDLPKVCTRTHTHARARNPLNVWTCRHFIFSNLPYSCVRVCINNSCEYARYAGDCPIERDCYFSAEPATAASGVQCFCLIIQLREGKD